MGGPGAVDPASPFFSAIASRTAADQAGARKVREEEDQKRTGTTRRFERVLAENADQTEKNAHNSLPSHLASLPPGQIVSALLDEVHSTGDLLRDNQSPDHIKAYKRAVTQFVRYVVDRSYALVETTSGVNILKRKKFLQVEVIDQKLEQLAAGVLSGQRNQMTLLARIEEINGLLVDLMS